MINRILEYSAVSTLAFLVYKYCSLLANAHRGYEAVGGEALILLIPIIWIIMRYDAKEDL